VSGDVARVVVDAFALTDGSQLRGLGTFLRNVLSGLAERPDLELVALARSAAELPEGVRRLPLSRHDVRPKLAHLEHELRLPRDLRRGHGDVVWSPGTHPPRRCRSPLVQTLHDLTPLVFRHWATEYEARRWERSARHVRQAARVVADSRSSADQAIRLLGVDAERVEVVHLGVEPQFSPGPAPPSDPPYVLFVGSWGPHKGYAEAMEVIAALADEGMPHRLRVVGAQDEWVAARVREIVDASSRPDRVEVIGWADDVVALYRGASALVFTSRAEGFGLPLLEASACGVPVVAFDNTSVREVLDGAGVIVPDGDITAFVSALRDVLSDDVRREELVEAGVARAAQFRWDDTVDRYHEILLSTATTRG
jgi:glycosyltransferase involved in cell wall biosynthesis